MWITRGQYVIAPAAIEKRKSTYCCGRVAYPEQSNLNYFPTYPPQNSFKLFKKLIARRGRPRVIYSDNGGAFVAANKWLRNLRREEKLMWLLEDHEISWRFNLSRAPWWGGQFERLVAVIKEAFYKSVGGGTLTWTELAEVILDVETQINRRPLTYVEDDVELPLLTPQTFLYQRSTQLPEQATHQIKGSYFIPKKITTSDFVYPKKSLLFLAYPKKSLRSFFATQKNSCFFFRDPRKSRRLS